MTYRPLDVDSEWPLIEHEFTSRGISLPDPRLAMIVGAFDTPAGDGVIPTLQGFLVCQLQFHLEPVVLYNPNCLRGLVRKAEEELGNARYFAFGGTPTVEKICLAFGMQPVPFPLYFKDLASVMEVKYPPPSPPPSTVV